MRDKYGGKEKREKRDLERERGAEECREEKENCTPCSRNSPSPLAFFWFPLQLPSPSGLCVPRKTSGTNDSTQQANEAKWLLFAYHRCIPWLDTGQ